MHVRHEIAIKHKKPRLKFSLEEWNVPFFG